MFLKKKKQNERQQRRLELQREVRQVRQHARQQSAQRIGALRELLRNNEVWQTFYM